MTLPVVEMAPRDSPPFPFRSFSNEPHFLTNSYPYKPIKFTHFAYSSSSLIFFFFFSISFSLLDHLLRRRKSFLSVRITGNDCRKLSGN
ncbi:hypothetical protein F8388_006922 [Cannabis sativa]|uniref:Uncharacterized protein n=1 Tax=Cannabis sativa TaxID=3483 RepID=A0A7J6GVL7_CANSA|nr:hypothetical protein F8388_006922 [Cannabis sativa]